LLGWAVAKDIPATSWGTDGVAMIITITGMATTTITADTITITITMVMVITIKSGVAAAF
jgi:hypothetical protein